MGKTEVIARLWCQSMTASRCVQAFGHGARFPLISRVTARHPELMYHFCRVLPFRGSTDPVFHAITTFTNVRLPPSALLGDLEKPKDLHANLMRIMSRVNIGTLGMGCLAVVALKCFTTISALYSLRRSVGMASAPMKRMPILSFPTQQAPILAAVANAYVLQAYTDWTTTMFCKTRDQLTRAGIAAVFKSVACQLSLRNGIDVSERCGAQGLSSYNQFISLYVSGNLISLRIWAIRRYVRV